MVTVRKNANVVDGPPCPGSITQEGQRKECNRPAILVVESRSMYKCAYGHRWPRDRASESNRSVD